MKKVLCILHGLPRTVRIALPLFMQRVVYSDLNIEGKYYFEFIVHSENLSQEVKDFLYQTLEYPNRGHTLKHIYENPCDPEIVTNSNDAYYFRLYDVFSREENSGGEYDMYINCRLDAVPLFDIPLVAFHDNVTIITGERIRPCEWHHRDWDYLVIGESSVYKLYHYLIINNQFIDWKRYSGQKINYPKLTTSGFKGTDQGWINGLSPRNPISKEIHRNLELLTGMRTDEPNQLLDNIILNIHAQSGKFYFSDMNTQIYSALIREDNFKKAF